MSEIPQPKKKKLYKRAWFWFLIVLLLAITIGSIRGVKSYQESRLSMFSHLEETVVVERRDVEKTISTSGQIVSDQTSVLSFFSAGIAKEVEVEVGEDVSVDDVLMKVEIDTGVSTSTEEIKAPFDGRVLAVHTFNEAAVAPGTPLIEVGYRSTHIEFLASESEVIDLEENLEVKMTVPSYDNGREEFEGVVEFVDIREQQLLAAGATGQPAESGYLVRVSVGDIPDELTGIIGLTVDMEVMVEKRQNVLSLITGAIQYDDGDNPFVYMVPTIDADFIARVEETEEEEELLERKFIDVGFEGDDYVEVTSGLRDRDEILLYVPSSGSSLF